MVQCTKGGMFEIYLKPDGGVKTLKSCHYQWCCTSVASFRQMVNLDLIHWVLTFCTSVISRVWFEDMSTVHWDVLKTSTFYSPARGIAVTEISCSKFTDLQFQMLNQLTEVSNQIMHYISVWKFILLELMFHWIQTRAHRWYENSPG